MYCDPQWSHVLRFSGILGQLCRIPVSIFKLWFPIQSFAVALRWFPFFINSKNEEHLVSYLFKYFKSTSKIRLIKYFKNSLIIHEAIIQSWVKN
jgi:hypothetical protein